MDKGRHLMHASAKTGRTIEPLPAVVPRELTVDGSVTVTQWNGKLTEALRYALRRTVANFAQYLGVSPRTVSMWASRGEKVVLTLAFQSILDAALERTSEDERIRFMALCHETAPLVVLVRPSSDARHDSAITRP